MRSGKKVKQRVLEFFLDGDANQYWNPTFVAMEVHASKGAVMSAIRALSSRYGGVRRIRSSTDARKHLVNIPLEYFPKEQRAPLTIERAKLMLHKLRKAQKS